MHRASFEAVTGPKRDYWLVVMVGMLAGAIGAALLTAAIRQSVDPQTRILASGSAAAFGLVDVFYSANGTIRSIYLADALIEAALLLAWMATFLPRFSLAPPTAGR
jgi:hypothetical protein